MDILYGDYYVKQTYNSNPLKYSIQFSIACLQFLATGVQLKPFLFRPLDYSFTHVLLIIYQNER